jgi:hypothetical protein
VPKPFEVALDELVANLDDYVNEVFADLSSSFLILPKGPTFIDYPAFEAAYEELKKRTAAFRNLDPAHVSTALREDALVFVVLRTVLGVTPPEWAELTREYTGVDVPQGWARSLEGHARRRKDHFARMTGAASGERSEAMVVTACHYISIPAPEGAEDTVHRLNKVDTAEGLVSLQHSADFHIPYAVLLYERYLGRPFASHKDSVSELVGDVMESAIEERLRSKHITFRKTARAERIPGFEQAPDFFIPTEIEPSVIIEAKLAGDDGTARDKVSRILRLCAMSRDREASGRPRFEVVACIDGRGFGIRREDMRQLLRDTQGKVFTLATIGDLIEHTAIRDFVPDPH